MMPLEPHETVPPDDHSTAGQGTDDENNAVDLVEIGLRTADTDLRDAATEHYVDEANDSDETEEFLADISRTESEEDDAEDRDEDVSPELDAIHLEQPPE